MPKQQAIMSRLDRKAYRVQIDQPYANAAEDAAERWRLVKRLHLAGLNLIPIVGKPTKAKDNFKKPALATWSEFNQRQTTKTEILKFFYDTDSAIGIVCGLTSNLLEVLDVENLDAWRQLNKLVAGKFKQPDLIGKLVIVRTPGHQDGKGGFHCYYRLMEPLYNWKGMKLAKRQPDKKDIIETRAQGNYVIAPGSPGRCHQTGRRYRLWQGDLLNVPIITTEERNALLLAAMELDETGMHDLPEQEQRYSKRPLPRGLPEPMDYWEIILADNSLTPTGSSGKWLKALCPLPDHPDTRHSLNVTVDGGFNCHGCGAKGGNILQFHELLLCDMDYVEVLADLRSMVG